MVYEVNVKKHYAYSIISVLVILIGVVGVNAYNSTYNDPSFMGHTANEIEGLVVAGGITEDFCVFSIAENACPDGFEEQTNFNGKTIRGIASGDTIGAVGGAETHIHGVNVDGGDSYQEQSYVQSVQAASSWQPYINVIMCCKND